MTTKTLLKLLVSAGLLAIILSVVSVRELWQALVNADGRLILLAFLFSPLILLGKGVKWLLLGRCVTSQISLFTATYSLAVGIGVSIATPGRVGEFARVSYLPTKRKGELLGVVAVDRLVDLTAILLVGALAIGLAVDRWLGAALLLPTLLLLVLLFIPQLLRNLANWIIAFRLTPAKNFLGKIARGLGSVNGRVLLSAHFIALFILGLGIVQFYWLLRAFGVDSIIATLVSFPTLTVASVIPVTISGFGTREGAAVLALALYNVPEAVAFNAALLSFACNTLIPGIFGLLISPLVSLE